MSNARYRLVQLLEGRDFGVDAELVSRASEEGVLALLERSTRGKNLADEGVQTDLMLRVRAATAESLLRQAEIRRIERALQGSSIKVLLLKGSALAIWLYPEAQLRDCGDIDLSVRSKAEIPGARDIMQSLGYQIAGDTRSTNHEVTCRLYRGDRALAEVDLHSGLVNAPLFISRFGFDELWQSGCPISGDGHVRYLAPAYAILHAAMHRAVDLSNGSPDRLKWLYDFHMFAQKVSAEDWRTAITLAAERGLAGTLLRSMEDAHREFSTIFPLGTSEMLAVAALQEPLDRNRISDWRYMQWQGLKAIPGVYPKLRWVLHRLVPTRSQMESLYGRDRSMGTLLGIRLRRVIAKVIGSQ